MSEPLALYVHWPFCQSKCPYCDFNSHVREAGVDHARFRATLRRELAHAAAEVGRRPLASIFFGGGTPSLMQPETVAALVADARALFDATPDLEVTLEANPTSVEIGKLRAFRDAGVNRASLGVQSLDAAALRFLGRRHDVGEATAALEAARAIFPRLSFDLIYARPGQAEAAWRAELRAALTLAADHLSLYQLTIEPGTRFHTEHARGAFALPDEEEAARMYAATAEEAARFGLAPYEVSNYARPGAESRHNLAYWRYGDYLGVGPGAHQRVLHAAPAIHASGLTASDDRGVLHAAPAIHASGLTASDDRGGTMTATRRHRAPEEWAARVERDGHGTAATETLSPAERAREALLMGLRLTEGVDPARLRVRSGLALDDALEPGMLEACLDAGYLEWRAGRLAATAEGRLRLDAMLPRLLR